MIVTEPSTMWTDYALAAESVVLAWRLGQIPRWTTRCWAIAFIVLAIAAAIGGIYHGLSLNFAVGVRRNIWQILLYITGFVSFFMVLGTAAAMPRFRQWIWAIAGFKLGVYLYWISHYRDFGLVVIDYFIGMLAVLLLVGWLTLKHQDNAVSLTLFAIAILISALAALPLLVRPHIVSGLTPEAIYHLIQMIALVFFYAGAKTIKT